MINLVFKLFIRSFKIRFLLVGCFLDAGEVALPGGKTEEGDADDIQTALREAKEEIGLDPSLVDVVTVLDPFITKVIMFFRDVLLKFTCIV